MSGPGEKGDVITTHEQFAQALGDKRVVYVARRFKDRRTSIKVIANQSYAVVCYQLRNAAIILADDPPTKGLPS